MLGSDMRNLDLFHSLPFGNGTIGPFPKLLPRFWSSLSEPLYVFRCKDENYCPGGRPGTCVEHGTAQSCSHCKAGYYWSGTNCRECAHLGASSNLFPTLPIVLILCYVILQYVISKEPNIKEWHSWGNMFSTGLFILLNYFQLLNILGSTRAKTPQTMTSMYEGFEFFTGFISSFNPACAGYSSLSVSMISKCLAPVGIALVCFVLYFVSLLLSKSCKQPRLAMAPNVLVNIFGGIMFTFFGAISAMSLELFKCSENPNFAMTMISDPSVTCYTSEEWKNMLGVAICSVVVYILGMLFGFVVVLSVAKENYSQDAFRQRWKFLFVKYQHGAYWWALVYLMRNFLVNLSVVVFSVAMYQCFAVMIISLLYLLFVALFWPYRSAFCNRGEMLCQLSIVINASIMMAYALADNEATHNTGVVLAQISTYSPTAIYSTLLGYLGFTGILIKLTLYKGYYRVDHDEKTINDLAVSLSESFTLIAGTALEDIAELLQFLSDSEIKCLETVDLVLRSESAKTQDTKSRLFLAKRLSTKKLPVEGKTGSWRMVEI